MNYIPIRMKQLKENTGVFYMLNKQFEFMYNKTHNQNVEVHINQIVCGCNMLCTILYDVGRSVTYI